MEYRLLEEKDAALMAAFVDDQQTAYNHELIQDFLRQENAVAFVAAESEKIIGFAFGYRMMKPDGRYAFYLHAIDVMEGYQHHGFGTGLMCFITEYVKKKLGCSKMFLLTEAENRAACACYKKAGGVRKDAVLYEFT